MMIKDFMMILIPLVIVMDPLGNLPFFLFLTRKNTSHERNKTAAVACITAALILIFFCLTGDFVLRFFNISLAAFQIAGGIIFFIYSLQMLCLIPANIKSTAEEEQEHLKKENVALVPLATPLLAGPGAITAVLVWRQKGGYFSDTFTLLLTIILSCILVYLIFRFAQVIKSILGVGGIRVFTRIFGLLLAVIAIEFIVQGIQQI
ncbi:MAG: NAAT family transporter [Gammaproteobacteria bacterium]|nr:NAAT family transporter [Gammaproteobacteria bacterium]